MWKKIVSGKCIVLIVIMIFILGFLPCYLLGLEAFAQFGAGFGFMAAIFSGFAFLAVVWTLQTQLKALERSEQAHAKQLAVAQTTARVQAFTVMAELHRDLVASAPDGDQDQHKLQSQYYGSRALDLMRELGETFPGDPHAAEIGGYTNRDIAIESLRQVVYNLKAKLEKVRDQGRNTSANHAIAEADRQIRQWFERYRGRIDSQPIESCLPMLSEKRTRVIAIKPDLEAFWEKTDKLVECLEKAFEAIESAEPGSSSK
ncbi:MAG: hypothetical protein HUJ26_04430 [Planctomycetaceae bacterium]|nr:hypothetical protein [Planctomycetaceae bacterium]